MSTADGNDTSGEVYGYPSTQIGNDPRVPVGPVNAFKTVAAAANKLGATNESAWILLKRGDTFNEPLIAKGGKSKDAPFVYSHYGNVGGLPILKSATVNLCCKSYISIVGLHFYDSIRNPADSDYNPTAVTNSAAISAVAYGSGKVINNILIEGNVLRFYSINTFEARNGGVVSNVVFRRNVVLDNYSIDNDTQGVFTYGVNGFLLEENIFDHNGWLIQHIDGNANIREQGQATEFNHNTYFANAKNVVFKNNAFFRPSSIGNKWTANDGESSAYNITIENNFYYDSELAISLDGNDRAAPYRFANITVTGNVVSASGKSNQTLRNFGWGIKADDWDGGLISGNIFIHQLLDQIANVEAMGIRGQTRNVVISDNAVYNMKNVTGLSIRDVGDFADLSVAYNEFTIEAAQGKNAISIYNGNYHTELQFQGNHYNMSGSSNWFLINGAATTYQNWLNTTQEANSQTSASYLDADRSVERYAAEVLGLASMDDFFNELRNQDMLNWRTTYTGEAINTWIKAGFGR